MKAPLVPVALVYAAGLLTGLFVEALVPATFVSAFIAAIAAMVFKPARPWLLAAAIFLFGWLNLTVRTSVISPVDLRDLVQDRELLVNVRGTLAEAPTHRVFLRDDHESWRTLAELQVDSIQISPGSWDTAHGRVLTLTSGVLTNGFVHGQRIEASGVLLRPPLPVATGLFDYRTHLARRGIHYQLKIESPTEWKPIGVFEQPPLTANFREWAKGALAYGLPEQDEALRLQWAMLLGWQTALTSEVSEPFMRSGTMHIFAISGLHIALIAGIFAALLRAVMIPRLACGAIIIPLLWFYTAATGWQPSAIRSTIMMSLIIFGWALKRPMNLLNSLAAAACIILVWDPQQLFQASFQLSFFVVLSIALLVPMLDAWKDRIFKFDPFLPGELRPKWQRGLMWGGNWIWKFFSTSLAAFLGSIPLIAYYFHLFTPGSLAANLVVVPVSSLALMSGLGAIITAAWLPPVAECFNHSGWFFMHAMVWLSERATELPASWIHVRGPGVIGFLLYYGTLLAWLGGWFQKTRWRSVLILMFIGFSAVSITQWWNARRQSEVVVLPLGGTHAVIARDANSSDTWVINCGEESSFPFVLKPFLQSRGENNLAHLVLAHGDTRHSGAMSALEKLFPIARVHLPTHPSRSTRFRELLSDLELRSTVQRDGTNGATVGPWHVLHPSSTDRFTRGEDSAIVLLHSMSSPRVLLMNDLGPAGQNAIVARDPDLQADIVIAGLPESGEVLPTELIERIRPKLIVIADSEVPTTRRASRAVEERLRRTKIPVLFTRKEGAVTITARDGQWQVSTARGQRD